MSELAFNLQGEPFEVPGAATSWRVRRIKSKGAPEVVYSRDGLPLILPIDADMEDLRRELGATSGRFRLDLLDESSRPLPGAQAGYVFVHPEEPATPASSTESPDISVEAMRLNAQLARSVVDRFSQMMESAAVLVRAVGVPNGGLAKLTNATVALDSPDDDSEDDDLEASSPPPLNLNALVSQVVTSLVTSIANGTLQLPRLDALLDWRKAATPKTTSEANDAAEPASVESSRPRRSQRRAPSAPPTSQGTNSVGVVAHLAAIQAALDPDERKLAQAMAAELSPDERQAWLTELGSMSVPDAVTRVRAAMKQKEVA